MSCQSLYHTLNNGNQFPLVGLGTYGIVGIKTVTKVIDEALSIGYRAFDTASMYDNEIELGKAFKTLLPKYGLTRQDIFITSKLAPCDQGTARCEKAARESVENLQCEYLDLYLIHWPGSNLSRTDPKNAVLRRESWSVLVKLHKEGLLKNIGVSNYTVRHIRELVSDCDGVKPVINQVEWHPHHHQQELLQECVGHGILLQAYSSLGGSSNKAIIGDPHIVEVAQSLGQPVHVVLLKWALQQGVAIIPKASSMEHLKANFNLDFVIPDEFMEKLSNLSTKQSYDWNPEKVV